MIDTLKKAEEAYPENQVRLQPIPNRFFDGTYQLHIRPRRFYHESDLHWKLVVEGTLEEIDQNLSRWCST